MRVTALLLAAMISSTACSAGTSIEVAGPNCETVAYPSPYCSTGYEWDAGYWNAGIWYGPRYYRRGFPHVHIYGGGGYRSTVIVRPTVRVTPIIRRTVVVSPSRRRR